MINICQFIGRLGKAPETRSVGETTVTNFSLACSKTWKDKQGQKQEKTEWVNCQAWGKLGGIVQEYTGKGSLLYVSGEMETRKYQDNTGADRYATSINIKEMRMLDSKGSSDNKYQEAPGQHEGKQPTPPMGEPDVPF